MSEQEWRNLLDRFWEHLRAERGLAPLSVRNYKTDLEPFLSYVQMRQAPGPRAVNRHFVRDYLAWLLKLGYVRSSVARKLSTLRVFSRWLVREGLIERDTVPPKGLMRVERRLPQFLGKGDAQALVEAPDISQPLGIRDRALLEILYAAGLRVSEVTGLNVSDLDLETRELRVRGKGSKERAVLMGREAQVALGRYLAEVRPNLLNRRSGDALFLNRYGNRLTQRSVQEKVRTYATKVSLRSGVHPHTMRHTFATHLLDGGADLRVVQDLLGHASPATTQIYTHVSQSKAREVYFSAHPRARDKGQGAESKEQE